MPTVVSLGYPGFVRYFISLCSVALFCILFDSGCTKKAPDNRFRHAKFEKLFHDVDSIANIDRKKGMDYMNREFYSYKKAGPWDIAQRYIRLVDYYLDVKMDYTLAMKYADSSITLLAAYGSDKSLLELYGNAYIYKGNIYRKQHQFDNAIENLEKGKYIISNGNELDICALRKYYEGMSNLYYNQERYEMAVQYFRISLEVAKSCLQDFLQFVYIQGNLDNIGLCYMHTNNFDSAEYYFREKQRYIDENARRFSRQINYVNITKALTQGRIVRCMFERKEFEKFEATALNGKAFAMTLDPKWLPDFSGPLFEYYLITGNKYKAEKELRVLEHAVDTLKFEPLIAEYLELRARYFELVNDYPNAFHSMRRAYFMRDSIERRDKEFLSVNLQRESKYREGRLVSESLEKDAKIKRIYLNLATVVIIMSFVIIALIGIYLMRTRKYIRKLKMLNTQVRNQNNELYETFSALETSNREIRRITKIVAHDLKNPISGMRNLIYSLQKDEHVLKRREVMLLIGETCADSLRMISALLNESKENINHAKEQVDMTQLIANSVELMQGNAAAKKLLLQIEAEQVFIFANKQNMLRVVNNLINNAVKFSSRGSVINIKLTKGNSTALVLVQDFGIGIPESISNKIFADDAEKMRQGTVGEESNGLGLMICKEIAEEHGGRLWFESVEGKGTDFYLELPLLD